MKISLVENIVATNLPVLDVANDDQFESPDLIISDGEVITIDIPDRPQGRMYPFTLQTLPIYIRQQVRQRLRSRIIQRFKDVVDKDIRKLVGEEEKSPPIIIYYEEDLSPDEFDNFVREHTRATFQVVMTDQQALTSVLWGEERLWRLDAPTWINHKKDLYYENYHSGMTCAYDYLTTKFSTKDRYKKIAKDKNAIDNVISGRYKKSEIHKRIYDEWLCLNKDKRELEHLIPQEIHPLPDIVEVGDLDDEMYKIEELDLKRYQYTLSEENDTLSILDLVKWCIAGNVRLNVFDFDNADYLSYNPSDFRLSHPDIKTARNSIAVKVSNKHAYFIDDADTKRGLSVSKTRYKLGLVDCAWDEKQEEKSDKGELDNEYHINRRFIGHPPEVNALMVEYDGYEMYKNCPPPQLNQLKEWMKDRTTLHHYYIGLPNINELVSRLYRSGGVVPDKSTGSAHSIKVATFGHLKIYSYASQPKEKQLWLYDELYKLYPDLKSPLGVLPTDTTIAEGVYDSCELPPIMSMMNSQTKRMFYESELKPDNRKIKGTRRTDIDRVSSFDVNKAYTTAMEFNEYSWNVYDAVSQLQKYRGEFNPNWFYLGYNTSQEYPCISGSGLLLYHGSLLKYVLDKVDIRYFIRPKSTLSKDHFLPFIQKCRELNEEIDAFQPKTLINRFIGNCKRKDGIQQYGLFIHSDKLAVMRQHLKNYIASRLNHNGLTWRNEPILTSRPQRIDHFENAQPIRLQVISICNEMNYKVYLHYRKCIYVYKFIHNFQNRLPMRKVLSGIRGRKSCISKSKNKMNWTPILEGVNTDALKFRNISLDDDINNKFAMYVIDTFNETSNTTKIKFEGIQDKYDYDAVFTEQLGMKYNPNRWDIDQTINYKWDKEVGGKLILNSLIRSGGGWVAGLGGRGKSELIKEFKKRCDRNKVEFKWIRLLSKMIECNRWDFQEYYLNNNPTTYECLAPTNKSANVIGGKTLHRGLGIMKQEVIVLNEEGKEVVEEVEPQPFLKSIVERYEGDRKKGIHPISAIVVDELSMVNGEMFSILAYIKFRIPSIKMLLFGDIEHQLPPVGEEMRNFNNAYVLKELSSFTKITLNYNFRIDVSGDKLWEDSANPELVKCSFNPLTDKNLCYTNKKRKEIIENRQDTIVNPVIVEYECHTDEDEVIGILEGDDEVKRYDERQTLKYTLGTPMIARRSNKEDRIAKNEMYIVVQLEPLRLYQEQTENTIVIDKEKLMLNFMSGLCITIHKSQGENFDDKYTIHEWGRISKPDKNGMNRKLRYTAQSRSTNPEKNISYRI